MTSEEQGNEEILDGHLKSEDLAWMGERTTYIFCCLMNIPSLSQESQNPAELIHQGKKGRARIEETNPRTIILSVLSEAIKYN